MKIFLINNCTYCFKDKRRKQPILNEILNKIKKAKKQVLFKGGEPLLRKDILKILKYTKSKNLKISLETSGILLNKNILKYVDKIYFIFDTSNFDDWKKITRKKRKEFNKTINAIKLAKRLRKKIYIDSLLTKLNLNSLEQTQKFCKKNKLNLRIIEMPQSNSKYCKSIRVSLKNIKLPKNKNTSYIKSKKKLLNKGNLDRLSKEVK